MKTKSKKIVCVVLAVLLIFAISIAVTGCDKEPGGPKYKPPKNCDVVLEAEGGWEASCEEAPYENLITICDTYEKLQEELLRHGIKMLEANARKIREYADEHKDKSFVVCFYKSNVDTGSHRLREVEVIDGKLTMYIWCERRGYAIGVEIDRIFIAGVDKSFVADVTACRYVFV